MNVRLGVVSRRGVVTVPTRGGRTSFHQILDEPNDLLNSRRSSRTLTSRIGVVHWLTSRIGV
eukprot:1084751-Prorocentrum_minimum.AAC.1